MQLIEDRLAMILCPRDDGRPKDIEKVIGEAPPETGTTRANQEAAPVIPAIKLSYSAAINTRHRREKAES